MADNRLSFLHVVKTPLFISDLFLVEDIVFPYSLGSFSEFPNIFLLKLILISFPKN